MSRLRFSARSALAPLLAALVLAGCATSPATIDPSSLPVTPTLFRESEAVAASPAAPFQAQWWKVFSDPVLDRLVDQATRSNSSVQVAAARLAQARAIAGATDANRSVQLGLGAGAVRQTDANANNRPKTLVSVGADLSYEVDLFGRLSGASDAASLDAASREALLRSTRLLVQADVAQTYLNLRALDTERAQVRDTLQAYRDTLRLTEVRFREGDVAELDVARARTEVASTESEALALDRRRAGLEHALAVLVGEIASSFQVAPAEWTTALPVIPAGVPSTVLVRRPDVSAAQSSMQAAQSRVGVAKAAWFPVFSLTANGGYAAPEISDLFKMTTRAWGVGALLSLPIFDGGRREAGVQNANAELDIALANYREQILVAFRDVEDQLSALRLLAGQSEAQSRSVASSSRATVLSDSRYRNGLVSQLEVLDAQRSELRNRRQALQVRAAQYLATVGLIRALGGGWV
ncbi:MAG: efflux transporter outer membrane subunit [Polaromonas sp.]|uniref:efflux transporter outer membrane subunit n=1 Tax=Polaromonas sp. TaxID=1869339 RepID=UPI00271C5E78|nr:efflux transporter outer membrane subunit [Polaromonas sp.]MDO9115187.1 efflux transporter outer membrane subunit [Polaromonas sp.]MDP1888095.1 efflux transporter outer membrane subunit [Polaromonas sp.]